MISYHETETGVRANINFAQDLQNALHDAGYSVFCYATMLQNGHDWANVKAHGVDRCKVFMPICSKSYADMDQSPWSYNELKEAWRRNRSQGGASPVLLPVWYSDKYPPADSGAFLKPTTRRVPAGSASASQLTEEAVIRELIEALRAVNVLPLHAPAS
jgi:hypothetical protein